MFFGYTLNIEWKPGGINMAGIDKTYCNNWEDYQELRGWADSGVVFTYSNGVKDYPSSWVPDYTEEDFKGNEELPIWNTPRCFDIQLILHCPVKFIQNRLQEQYGSDFINKVKLGQNNYIRKGLGKNIRVKNIPNLKKGVIIFIHIPEWWYDEENDYWSQDEEEVPWNTNACIYRFTSKKSLYRKFKHWNLPEGLRIELFCDKRYIIRTKSL